MSAETLRKWLRQSEIDAGSAPGVTTEEAAQAPPAPQEGGGAGADDRVSSRPRRVSSRGRTTRDRADLPVHRRLPAPVRGRADLRALSARAGDRPEDLLGKEEAPALGAGAA